MHTKRLTDSDLGTRKGNNTTHIGLHQDMLKGWAKDDKEYDAYLFVDDTPEPFACKGLINAIERKAGTVEAPKLKSGPSIPEDQNLLKLIRKYGSEQRRWLTVGQLPDGKLLVFLAKGPTTVDSITEDAVAVAEGGEATGLGRNLIYFGPPGTGKSAMVKRAVGLGHKIRTQFHPEYTHGDFVGSYRPVVGIEKNTANTIETYDGENGSKPVNYFAFVPGPFTLALEKAFTTEDHVFLVIEEINRGDCAAIFGDVFQLLDRKDDGWSDYGILPKPEMAAYFKSREVPYNADGGDMLYLPPNLSLLATMNTSDQSLHPMDSAFKRRWHWVACHVDYDQLTDYTGKVRPFLQDKKRKWDWIHLLENLNADIVSDTMEDRQVGPWFIKPEKSGAVSFETFLNKCLFYLWHDVFKDEQFSSDYSPFRKDGPKTFGDLQKRIRQDGLEAGIKPELLKAYQEEESHSADSSDDSAPAVAVDNELAQAQDDETDSTS